VRHRPQRQTCGTALRWDPLLPLLSERAAPDP
jgi:hypothetical protein